MKILISPAKKLDFDSVTPTNTFSQCKFLEKSQELITILREKPCSDIADFMGLSTNLAELNQQRYQDFQLPFTLQNAKQALFAFKGDVYQSMQADTFTDENILFAQKHLYILSGLYGILKPLDLMQAYRLEMGTKLANNAGKNLYDFWGMLLTDQLNKELVNTDSSLLINLASQEYFKAINTKELQAKIITPVFKQEKILADGQVQFKTVGILAKRARGLMTRYIIENELTNADDLKSFTINNYKYHKALSTDNELVFIQPTETQ